MVAVGVAVGEERTPWVADGVGVAKAIGTWTTEVAGVARSPQADTDRTETPYDLPGLGLLTV
jgi:N-acetylmuramic acid 6-phosphate (MurNAc-6-P) etherase